MLLTVSAAAIALPASASGRFQLRLQSVECVGVAINFYVTAVGNNAKARQDARSEGAQRAEHELDGGDRRVVLERLGDRGAALGAELVRPQAARCGMIGMRFVTPSVTTEGTATAGPSATRGGAMGPTSDERRGWWWRIALQ